LHDDACLYKHGIGVHYERYTTAHTLAYGANEPADGDRFPFSRSKGAAAAAQRPADLWAGISTFDDAAIAADVGRKFGQGDYLAGGVVTADGPIRWAKTRGARHHTLWGTPRDILARVTHVIPLSSVVGEHEP